MLLFLLIGFIGLILFFIGLILTQKKEPDEREISLTILQTAEQGADSAHFLVSKEPEITSPVKSAVDILVIYL